jgi:hypothetical protein
MKIMQPHISRVIHFNSRYYEQTMQKLVMNALNHPGEIKSGLQGVKRNATQKDDDMYQRQLLSKDNALLQKLKREILLQGDYHRIDNKI